MAHSDLKLRLLAGCAVACAALAPAAAFAQLPASTVSSQVSSGYATPTIGVAGSTTDITLNAPRTILNWSSYNLTSDQTVIYRFQDASWIALNKVSGSALIDGQIEALVGSTRGAGNVWFSAPGGVIIGPNARVNVGGLLATTGTVSAAFLDTSTSSFDFTGAGAGSIQVKAGAQVQAGGGGLALIAGSVSTDNGASVIANSSVLYGAANDFTVRFGAQPGDLDLLDFVVPAGSGTTSATPLNLQGQTVGANVFLAVVNRADVASAVINAPGLIAASTASASGGDVILTSGAGIASRQPSSTRVNSTTQTTATFGVVTAQRDVLGAFGSPTTVSAGQIAGGRDVAIAAASLNLGGLNAGRSLIASGDSAITLTGGASAGGGASFRTNGALLVGGGTGVISALGNLQISAATVQAGALNTGGSLAVTASGVLAASGANSATNAVNVGSILVGDDATITATNAAGSIVLGQATFTGQAADSAPAGRNLTLAATGATADVTYGAAAGSTLNGATGVTLKAGRDVTANVNGLLTLTSGSAGRTFTIRAQDLDLLGPLTATDLRVESLQGAMTLGGTGSSSGAAAAGAPGLRITNAEFQNILVTHQANFYAGSPNGTARGDLTVQDLNVNPARVPHLLITAGSANDVVITGVLAPTINGGTLVIGDTTVPAFTPGRILISGSVGFSTGSASAGFSGIRAFDEVDLNATNDILLGSQRFLTLVGNLPANQIDLANNRPAGVAATPDELGHIYLTAGILSLSAPSRIVQQNTGAGTTGNGLFLNNNPTNPVDGVLTISRAAQVVDLYGALRDRNGAIRSNLTGGLVTNYSGGGGYDGSYEIYLNGHSTAASSPLVMQSTQAASQITALTTTTSNSPTASATGDTPAEAAVSAATSRLSPQPVLLAVAQPSVEVEIAEPVVIGTGSEEVWRSRAKHH